MIKKILTWTLLVGFIGLLVFGAINRTLAKTENKSLVSGLNRTASANLQESSGEYQSYEFGQSPSNTGSGNGNGNSRGGGNGRNISGSNPGAGADLGCTNEPGSGQAQIAEWLNFEAGVSAVESGLLILTTADGEQVEIIGRTLRYIQEMGFVLQVGDQVNVSGFYDANNVLEIASIENITNGTSLTIREETGRPRWAGGGSF